MTKSAMLTQNKNSISDLNLNFGQLLQHFNLRRNLSVEVLDFDTKNTQFESITLPERNFGSDYMLQLVHINIFSSLNFTFTTWPRHDVRLRADEVSAL